MDTQNTEGNDKPEKKKFNPFQQQEYPRKIIIKWEGDMIAFDDFTRMELVTGYDTGQDCPTWGITMMYRSYPFSKTYYYYSEEVREEKLRLLQGKIAQARVIFV